MLRQVSGVVSPWNISASNLARPRVECFSSRVARYDGHMTPVSSLRHRPTPTQRSTAAWMLPSSSAKEKCVGVQLRGPVLGTVAHVRVER